MSKFNIGKASVLALAAVFAVATFLLGKSVTTVSAVAVNPCLGSIPSVLIVDITEGVTNDADSGVLGNYWAIDNYTRHIKVWPSDSETSTIFCADVSYDGTFDVQPGVSSPQNGNPLTGNEDGIMTGSRRIQINGSILSSPLWPTTGDVGTFNYNCDLSGNCPDFVKWQDKYFQERYDYSDLSWAWTYTSCGHGSWVNASTGNSGDIVVGPTDEVCGQAPVPTPTASTSNGGSGVSDGLGCANHDCSVHPSTPQGQVLGASTMAGTGSFDETLYSAIMSIGATLSAFGIKGLKKAKKVSKK